LQHKYDRPQELLGALSRYAYYQSGPRLWNAKPEEVSRVRRADLLEIARGRFQTGRVVFAVSGDFDRDSMITTLKTFFAQWQVANLSRQAPQSLQLRNKPGVYLADKAITQANITMAQPFLKRPHPDYYAASVASYILGGGGFTSRLTLRVRSDEGLAYSINSFAQSDYDDVASAGISVQTKVESASFAIKIAFEEIRKLGAEGPTAEELEGAKKSLIESLPGMFESPHSTADAFARSEMWGRSPDHFRNYPAEIRQVTAADVKRCIQTYFTPEKMTISIVGPVTDLVKRDELHKVSLADFGSIRVIASDSLEMR
jgi:zinc protease